MSQGAHSDDRLRELQADRAMFGLSDAETRELAELEAGRDSDVPDEMELTAAALDVGLTAGDEESLPAHLREKILAASRPWSEPVAPPPVKAQASATLASSLPAATAAPSRRREFLAWFAAAAATLLAVYLGTRASRSESEPSLAALRERLLALRRENPADVVQVAWTRGADETGAAAAGDVIWSDREQAGVMRFRGLASNDPTRTQYQLWIVDPTRDKNPVDGGVFDIPAGAEEVLVPIHAKLPVSQPTLFAVTVEKPGGVVVSDQSRMPLLAQVER